MVLEALSVLDAEQLYVVVGIYWGDCTEAELAGELTESRGRDYNRDRIHRIKLTSLAKMRRAVLS
jgi:hypothetical protein